MPFRPLLLALLLLTAGCSEPEPSASPAEAAPGVAEARHDDAAGSAQEDSTVHVLIVGNSLAAGYGLEEPERQRFPALLQQRLDTLGWDVDVRNAALSGQTSAGGLTQLPWRLRQPVDVLFLELGGNDGLRGIDPAATRQNLQAIIDSTRARYPDAHVVLAGMQIPPNYGADYAERFADVYPALAEANEGVTLIPFLLEGVGGDPALNQPDGIHPTAEGQRRVATHVWPYLEEALRAVGAEPNPEDCEGEELTMAEGETFDLNALAATGAEAEPCDTVAVAP